MIDINTNGLWLLLFVVVVRTRCDESVDSSCSAVVVVGGSAERVNDTDTDLGSADVQYWLYTRERPKGQRFDLGCRYAVQATAFDARNPTKILVHGRPVGTVPATTLCRRVKQDYLHAADSNVICVYWTRSSPGGKTAAAAAADIVKPIGRALAGFVEKLTNGTRRGYGNVHMIGHGAGAHIVGVAGKTLNNGTLVSRITGLDPAGPAAYESRRADVRIGRGDAKFVDVIHTNSAALGPRAPVGDIDFYPNGGGSQPRCGSDAAGACSHLKAIEYFAYSILEADEFEAFECSGWHDFENGRCDGSSGGTANMGEHVDPKQSGTYYLKIDESYD